jgi:hypothetical protein
LVAGALLAPDAVAVRPPSLVGIKDPHPASASAARAVAVILLIARCFIPRDHYRIVVNTEVTRIPDEQSPID